MNPKARNAIAETVAILGIAYSAIPSWSQVVELPRWLGLALTLAITVLNQLLKDSQPHAATVAAVAPEPSPSDQPAARPPP